MRTCAKCKMSGVWPRDVEGVWIREVLRVAIRQSHFQDYALALRNCDTRQFQSLVRFPRQGMNRAAIAKQFLHGLRH